MNRLPLCTLLLAALLAFAAQAQDSQKPAAKPAAEATQDPAAARPAAGTEPDPKIIEGIMTCLANGLPPDWRRAWFVIGEAQRDKTGKERTYVALFFYATEDSDLKGKKLQTCGPNQILEGVGKLNDYLPADQQRWTGAKFTFHRDGRYDVAYDYTPPKPAAKPGAKPAAKKKQESAK